MPLSVYLVLLKRYPLILHVTGENGVLVSAVGPVSQTGRRSPWHCKNEILWHL